MILNRISKPLIAVAFAGLLVGACSSGEETDREVPPESTTSASAMTVQESCEKLEVALDPLGTAETDTVAVGNALAELEDTVAPELTSSLSTVAKDLQASQGNTEVLEEGSEAWIALTDLEEQCKAASVTID